MPFIYVETLPDDLPEGFESVNAYTEEQYNQIASERDTLQSAFDKASNDILDLQNELKSEKSKFAKAFLDSTVKKTGKENKDSARKPTTVDSIWG